MKKIFYCLLLAVMLSSCGGETKKSEAKQEPGPEVAVEKQVGDIIMVNGAMGIVYAVTPDGQHGMVVSVAEGLANFEAAKQWCAQYGNGWRLPSGEELLVIYKQKNVLNPILEANGYTALYEWYWSSKESDPYMVIYDMNEGHSSILLKRHDCSVRAVCEF